MPRYPSGQLLALGTTITLGSQQLIHEGLANLVFPAHHRSLAEFAGLQISLARERNGTGSATGDRTVHLGEDISFRSAFGNAGEVREALIDFQPCLYDIANA